MITRRSLYAAGLPLGESVTRVEGCRRIYGGGGDSSSSSSSQQTTNNADNRIVNQGGAVLSGGASITGLTINDPTAQVHAMDVVSTSTTAALTSNVLANEAAAQVASDAAAAAGQAGAAAAAAGAAAADAGTASANAAAIMSGNSAALSRQTTDSMKVLAQDVIAGNNALARYSLDMGHGAFTDALIQSTNSIGKAAGQVQTIAQDAMAGTWAASKTFGQDLIGGMNSILAAGQDLMQMQADATGAIGGQIDAAYKTATDVSTGNRQLVTTGLVVIGVIAAALILKGKFA